MKYTCYFLHGSNISGGPRWLTLTFLGLSNYLECFHREVNGTPLQYSCLENPMDRGAWQAVVHEDAKSRTRLSDVTFPFQFHVLEKDMAAYSSVFAWRIPGTGEPGGLLSMGLHKSDTTEAPQQQQQQHPPKLRNFG